MKGAGCTAVGACRLIKREPELQLPCLNAGLFVTAEHADFRAIQSKRHSQLRLGFRPCSNPGAALLPCSVKSPCRFAMCNVCHGARQTSDTCTLRTLPGHLRHPTSTRARRCRAGSEVHSGSHGLLRTCSTPETAAWLFMSRAIVMPDSAAAQPVGQHGSDQFATGSQIQTHLLSHENPFPHLHRVQHRLARSRRFHGRAGPCFE